MAEKRMMTRKVTDDDHFINLSSSAQALYLHLSMCADDDGFCNQVSVCMFRAHASTQDLQALLDNRYLLQFDNGVIVIKHWRMANSLRKDRYTPTAFQEELAQLEVKENGAYTLVAKRLPDGCQMVAGWLPQISIDKNSIDKNNKWIDGAGETPAPKARKKTNSEKNIELFKSYAEGDDGLKPIYETMLSWMQYKGEKGKPYTETGVKSLITQVKKHCEEYGTDAVADCIELSMSNQYQGIIWDKLKKHDGSKKPMTRFHNMEQRDIDFDSEAADYTSLWMNKTGGN